MTLDTPTARLTLREALDFGALAVVLSAIGHPSSATI
jgi:hypothetical protein